MATEGRGLDGVCFDLRTQEQEFGRREFRNKVGGRKLTLSNPKSKTIVWQQLRLSFHLTGEIKSGVQREDFLLILI